jgi:hypothetical protein
VTLSSPGAHTIKWAVTTPRALKLRWALVCGGATVEGSTGEAFADYQTRRLAELRAEKQREQDAVASLVGAVGAAATVRTPDGEATAGVHADGDAVADAVVSDDVALPAGDLGASVYHGSATINALEAGACTMNVTPEDPAEDPAGVVAEFQVTREIDLAFERAQEHARRRDAALEVRGALSARLIAQGADPDHQRKLAAEREAELRIRIDIEAQAQAELDAQLAVERAARNEARWQREQDELHAELELRAQIEARIDAALDVRARLTASLIAQGADPDFQRRRIARIEEEQRLYADAEGARLLAEQEEHDRAGAERRRRIDGAIAVRFALLAYLEGLGAFAPPPMPELPYEDRGEPPGSGSVWIAGEWVWRDRDWQWISGGWSIPSGSSTTTTVVDVGDTVETDSDAGISVGVSIPVPVIVIEHRDDPPPPKRPKTRDHRK